MDKFTITNEYIEQAVAEASAFMEKNKTESKNALRLSLALEEVLLNYRDALGEESECELRCVRRFGRLRMELTVTGESHDPFAADGDEDFSRMLMAGMGLTPVWQYKNGQNIVVFTPKRKKPSQMVYILAALVLAVICGLLSGFLPQNVQTFIVDDLLTPISDTFLGLLNGVAGFMIFLSVTWSICSIGDVTTLTHIGKKMIGRMLFMLVAVPTVFIVCVLPLFHFATGSGGGSVDLSEPFAMILGIIPTNLVAPFVEGNFLQIMFLAAIVGIALLVLGAKASLVTSFIEQANLLVQLILEALCAFISLIIFISIYTMVLTGSFTVLVEAYKAPLLIVLGCLFAMGAYVAIICLRFKVSPAVFLQKTIPAFLIALTTASSAAALSTMMDTCRKKLGVDKKIVNFGIPVGQILFGMGTVMDFLMLSFCMAEVCDVAVTPVWIVVAIFTSVILTMATPPIAGGGVAICTILFGQLGIPAEGLAVAVAIDVISDFLITATDVFCRQAELVVLSGKLKMLDTDTLRKKMK